MDVGKRVSNSATLAAKPTIAEPNAAAFRLCPSGNLVDGKLRSSSSLMDVYEIACITRELNRLLLRASAAAHSAAAFAGSRRPPEKKVSGLRGFLTRQTLAFCGPDGGCSIVLPEGSRSVRRRCRVAGGTADGRTDCQS
ncbi:hypothetical protein HPP92_005895 [Vanilla planifolia]|uniref:Uncharacterized protein n=1 Tax=Vanilla planifolia TaxID=51239 RepID=A0A835RMJ6_VANPL|nr:hypothetical protein HPP92_006156 [Vanilla planifolia]KAG0494901.1 hypothetical protein HPP92_005895 [Vanilla planifolia]